MPNRCPTCTPSMWDCPTHAPKHMAAGQRIKGPIDPKPTGANTALEGAWEVARAVALIDKQLLSSDAVKAFAGLADAYASEAALWREVRPMLRSWFLGHTIGDGRQGLRVLAQWCTNHRGEMREIDESDLEAS